MRVGKLLPEAARSLWRKPATVRYPAERLPVPEGFRGAPAVDEPACIGCRICERQCPARAISMAGPSPKELKPEFHYDACIFCGVCAESCPKKAIAMTREFEMASTDRRTLIRRPRVQADPAVEAGRSAHQPE